MALPLRGTKERIFVDARRSNFIFASPPAVELASSETFARLAVLLPGGDFHQDMAPLTLGTCDAKEAFRRFGFRER